MVNVSSRFAGIQEFRALEGKFVGMFAAFVESYNNRDASSMLQIQQWRRRHTS
jgi:hypothetical protein